MLVRRACALAAVLAMLVGPLVPPVTTSAGCGACPPGCPMHTGRLGCHRTQEMGCHRTAPAAGIRNACGHGREAASSRATAFRGMLPAVVDVRPRLAVEVSTRPIAHIAARPLPEPPTGPPRSSVV